VWCCVVGLSFRVLFVVLRGLPPFVVFFLKWIVVVWLVSCSLVLGVGFCCLLVFRVVGYSRFWFGMCVEGYVGGSWWLVGRLGLCSFVLF